MNLEDAVVSSQEHRSSRISEGSPSGSVQNAHASRTGGARTIGLCMIVKDETKVIRRCLESTLPLVDYILVVDTGSTDGTQQVIRDFLDEKKIAGAVLEEPWRDFAYNRSYSLARLREVRHIDYALVIDADDRLELDPGFDVHAFKRSLDRDFYDIPIRHRTITHHRPQLLSNRRPFHFKGILHEYVELPRIPLTRGTGKGLAIHASTDGARSQDKQKYEKDAVALEAALKTESDPFLISRYTFYLAQSYRDCGNRERAIDNYLRRAKLGYWNEEIYVSLYEAAKLMAVLNRPREQVIATFNRASQTIPGRAEALHGAARYCRNIRQFNDGYVFARDGLTISKPTEGLFVEPWIYDYGLLDEYAVNAYWIGQFGDCLNACERLLMDRKMPQNMVARIEANAQFARQRINQAAARPEKSLDHIRDLSAAQQPRVLLAILAKQKERVLPFYLTCIDALDYPKDQIVLHVRTNNNSDATTAILQNWLDRIAHQYSKVEFDSSDAADRVENFGVHEWNSTRFKVLARIRNESMQSALRNGCDFYFVVDVDNFVQPHTLKSLISSRLPIVAPLLRHETQSQRYSNFHETVDARGYFVDSEPYNWLLYQRVRGLCQVPVVHCTYLVRSDAIQHLSYSDATIRHEYVIFSESARRHEVPQYLDNRDVYGYLTLDETPEPSVRLIGSQVSRAARKADIRATRAKVGERLDQDDVSPVFIHSSWRTSSTWFWSRFRQLPCTLGFFEPFNQFMNTITAEQALAFSHKIWGSRHSPTEPYCYEYLPLIRRSGGVRLFKGSLSFDWFIPQGGLQGKLRHEEIRYLALLLREAQRRGRVPVLGFCRSLGRISAIKEAFGGLNIFLLRNLWQHWVSYVALREKGDRFFYDTVPLLVNRQDDSFLAYLAAYYLERAAPQTDKARLAQMVGTPRGRQLLAGLPEADMFAMFMGLHIYLYLHAQMCADLTVDTTRMTRDKKYRSDIEDELRQRTRLPISFDDSKDQRLHFDRESNQIDWDAIREHADKAIHALRPIGQVAPLANWARSRINDAFVESRMQGRTAGAPYQRYA